MPALPGRGSLHPVQTAHSLLSHNAWKETHMNPHRKMLLSISMILTLAALPAVIAQSPGNTPARGKNGSAQERKVEETKREGVRQQQPESLPIQRSDSIQPNLSDSPRGDNENIRLAVDLVVLDALVIQQKTGRVAGNLNKEDFLVAEDGVRQEITHFSQDTLPLSVILLIDRGGCLDPFSDKVRHATLEALQRLRSQDEVALMSFANTTELLEGFGRGKARILDGLDHLPPHDENADHCFNRAFYEAADYMRRAGN